ncbi:MAG: phenylalanine--tRNA ligase subunit alpha, partial [Deltaproteobacteria bacterium]|nr:phenylalanine--tRNA ligase subunit alpha [Deltaproteobacteria bacterium]
MENELQRLENEAKNQLDQLNTGDQFEEFRIRFLGRKGLFSSAMRQLGSVAKEDRPRLGQLANSLKKEIEELFEIKRSSLKTTSE